MVRSFVRHITMGGALAAACLLTVAKPEPARAERAGKAYDFVESIGVVGHISRRKGVLNDAGWAKISDAIGDAGIRYMRTTITNGTGAARANALHYEHGVRFNFGMDSRSLVSGDPQTIPLDPSKIATMIQKTKDAGTEVILSYEGPNEYSSQKKAGNDNWHVELKNYQRQLYNKVKADPQVAGKLVLAPTIWRREVEDYQKLGNIANITDKGNLHKYHSGRMPSYLLDESVQDTKILTPNDRVFVTEYGYTSGVNSQNVWYPITEYSQAKYVGRYLGEFFIHPDVEKSFIYQIIDEKPVSKAPDKAFGLLRNDHSKRPMFFAVKNAIALLDEPDGNFTPGSLDYDLTGDITDVHSFLVQKKNGTFYLVLWQEVESYDRESRTDLYPPDRRLTLNLRTPVTLVRTYMPTGLDIGNPENGRLPRCVVSGVSGCQNGVYPKGQSIDLRVPDELLVIEIQAGDGPPPPPPDEEIVASAGAGPVSGVVPLSVSFTGAATPTGSYTYSWNFGDGAVSNQRNPSHTYSSKGTYNAVLTVRNGTETAQAAVTIYALPQPSQSDTKKPTVPKDLTAELASSKQIDFSWTPSTDNTGVAHYNIFEDDQLIATSAGPSYSFSAKKSKWYDFEISAEDAAGNKSAKSDNLKVYIYRNRLVTR